MEDLAKEYSFVLVTPFSSQTAYKGDSESRKFGFFQRTYLMDGTVAKNSTTKISAIR